jgi:iron complex transport system ATP-binding protein
MIKLVNVSAGYGTENILKNIYVEFKKRKINCIIGPNGCGKTTLLKTMARLLRPADGQILLENKNIYSFAPREFAQKVALMPQNRTSANMSVESLVMHGRFPYCGFSRKPSKKDIDAVREAMRLTDTMVFRHKNIMTLSGGERQRVYIAMAVAQDTDVILLDEPTTHLDVAQQLEIIELIKLLNEKGKTIIMILHDISLAMLHSDLLCVMKEGQILGYLPPQQIYDKKLIDEAFGIICMQNTIHSRLIYTFDKQK